MEKAERFASRMIQRLCPAVDLEKALINYKQYDPHDGLLLIGIGEIKRKYILTCWFLKKYTKISLGQRTSF